MDFGSANAHQLLILFDEFLQLVGVSTRHFGDLLAILVELEGGHALDLAGRRDFLAPYNGH